MYYRLYRFRLVVSAIVGLVMVTACPSAFSAATQPNTEGKVVLANLDRYDTILRFGKTRREIKPKKASALSPELYPLTIEFWSGNTKVGWKKQTIPAAGIYGFNFKRGNWTLTQLKKGKTTRPAKPTPSTVVKQRIVRQPVRRLPINADRARWSPLAHVAWFAASIYQFVRDEKDRDLLRELLIRGREEDLREFERWLRDSDKIAVPYKEEPREAYDELAMLTDEEWKEIETADENAWDQARADLGDLISADDWKNLTDDFAEIDTSDFWQDNVDVDLDRMAAEGIRFTDAQLYAFDAPYTQTWSERERWVKTQFAQYQAGKEIDRAQCIVLNDFSTPFDIHPKSKLDAAERYAAWALCETYGREILPGGRDPISAVFNPKSRDFTLTFDRTGDGLKTSDGHDVKWFQIGDSTGRWVGARARFLNDRRQLLVRTSVIGQLKPPYRIRHAWSNVAMPNLVNSAGMPASCFEIAVR